MVCDTLQGKITNATPVSIFASLLYSNETDGVKKFQPVQNNIFLLVVKEQLEERNLKTRRPLSSCDDEDDCKKHSGRWELK